MGGCRLLTLTHKWPNHVLDFMHDLTSYAALFYNMQY